MALGESSVPRKFGGRGSKGGNDSAVISSRALAAKIWAQQQSLADKASVSALAILQQLRKSRQLPDCRRSTRKSVAWYASPTLVLVLFILP
jgi:hypothetical protein